MDWKAIAAIQFRTKKAVHYVRRYIMAGVVYIVIALVGIMFTAASLVGLKSDQ